MVSIALIGGDGAGKTTIANAVIASSDLPMKYIYMGLGIRSSNHRLPLSRLVLEYKKRRYANAANTSNPNVPGEMPASALEYSENEHGWIWNTARFLNRLAEAWYRQLISITYQLRGTLVVYDRHFYFDAAPGVINSKNQSLNLLDQWFFWLMSHLYPKPSLTIFLNAPAELLFSRKGEASPEYLEQQRKVFLAQGKKLKHFVAVDASQPLEQVLIDVKRTILEFYAMCYPQRVGPFQMEELRKEDAAQSPSDATF